MEVTFLPSSQRDASLREPMNEPIRIAFGSQTSSDLARSRIVWPDPEWMALGKRDNSLATQNTLIRQHGTYNGRIGISYD